MKFWCQDDETLVEADSFEENDDSKNSPHNGVVEHTHCANCQGHLYLKNCRDLDYIQARLKGNKVKLDRYGAKEVGTRGLEFHPIELLREAQSEEKDLLYAQGETFRLKHEGSL